MNSHLACKKNDSHDPASPENFPRLQEKQSADSWAVYYDDNFWERKHEGVPCDEIVLEKRFTWAGREWYVPSVYTCDQGMVVDILMRIDGKELRSFQEKCKSAWENEDEFTDAKRRQMEQENPTAFHFHTVLTVNGMELKNKQGCAILVTSWDEDSDKAIKQKIMVHYHLNPADGWLIRRSIYPWTEKKTSDFDTLTLILSHHPDYSWGETFIAAEGGSFPFSYPLTGKPYTLTVREIKARELAPDQSQRIRMELPDLEYPNRYYTITYTVTPAIETKSIRLTDCSQGDRPRKKSGRENGVSAIGIILGCRSGSIEDEGSDTAASSLYFNLPEQVRWQISFREKQWEKAAVKLIE